MSQQQVDVFYVDTKGATRDRLPEPTLAYFIGGPLDLMKRVLDHRPNDYLVGVVPLFDVSSVPGHEFERPIPPGLHKYTSFGRVPSAQDITSAHLYIYVGPVN